MEYVALGRTNVLVSRAALAAGSLRTRPAQEQAALFHLAYDEGINYFDAGSAGAEVLPALAAAFHEIRQNVLLGVRLAAGTPGAIRAGLEAALEALNTDYIDLLHITGLDFLPAPEGDDGIARELEDLKKQGKIRFAGIAEPFSFAPANLGASVVFEALGFSFNLLNQEQALPLAELCQKREIGCLASDPLCAPFEEIAEAFGFLRRFEHVIPLWEIRDQEQMRTLLNLVKEIET